MCNVTPFTIKILKESCCQACRNEFDFFEIFRKVLTYQGKEANNLSSSHPVCMHVNPVFNLIKANQPQYLFIK